ncbi:DUF2358 domain-containing protein [Nodosilinea sp. FACHB-13]|uniref:DUF2358 domain-containing protein n=1 Tax=Cyanophyceae TaxID=3028117 RepID=UPI001686896B|nr:DUF2358 domain-containing protein [Nodosilinea sp. FACHB-13]MBD2107201.1 DUF2358 domain-containing protein [Nodosilinea sp. FACHB-13]
MDILEQIRIDYERFPCDQSYHLYAEDVYFKDPLNKFRGVDRYRLMIGFISHWFKDVNLQLHGIEYSSPSQIDTRWTLSWIAPVPWQPRMSIPGRSELGLGEDGKVISHIDYWDCSRLSVLKQLFALRA